MDYVATIGLECHAQLRTRSKMFCGCPVDNDAPPNAVVCPICLGHPGTLPRLNGAAVVLGVRAGLALGCAVNTESVFSRKHYFYPDLPKGYQISQYDRPLCTGGRLHVELGGERRSFELIRIHLEEDAGRMHHTAGGSGVDWNRGGVPLIEIVGAPDLHSPEEAEAWLRALHRVLVTAGLCTGDMEKGHFRCDANVSVAPVGGPPGTRVEIKNVNSFRFVARALRFEIDRQTAVLQAGGKVDQETRTWTGRGTATLRKKEGAADYRYFPEPDLPALRLTDAERAEALAALPGVPMDLYLLDQDARIRAEFQARTGLGDYEVGVLLGDPQVTAFFEGCLAAGGEPRAMANLVMGELMRCANQHDGGLAAAAVRPEQLKQLDDLVRDGRIPRQALRGLLEEMFRSGADPARLAEERGLTVVSDTGALEAAVDAVIAGNPGEVERYRAGNKKLMGFFVGQAMKVLGGKADARALQQRVLAALEGS